MATPTKIKAQALALLIQGHSCREVRRRLQRDFPGADIPHHSTIARWMQRLADSETKAAITYWAFLAKEVASVLLRRMDGDAQQMSLMELAQFASRVSDIYYSARERRRSLALS